MRAGSNISVESGLTSWNFLRGFFSIMVQIGVFYGSPSVQAQEVISSSVVDSSVVDTSNAPGRVVRTENGRIAWGLSETDWSTYEALMEGPAGLWYSHVSPTIVLGIHAGTEAERERFAKIVHEQERDRLDALLRFNRTYLAVARAGMTDPGFEFLAEAAEAGLPASLARTPSRILVFVGPDCPRCDQTVRDLADSGRPFDIYYVGAASNAEISRWARQVGLPSGRVRNRTITLNHDRGVLAGAGHSGLPRLFSDPALRSPVSLQAALQGATQ